MGPVGCATEQLVQRYDEARASSQDGSRAQHRKEWLDELAAAYEHFCHRAQTRIEHRERTFEFNSRAGRKSSRRLINPVVIRRQIKIKADVAGSRQAQKVRTRDVDVGVCAFSALSAHPGGLAEVV